MSHLWPGCRCAPAAPPGSPCGGNGSLTKITLDRSPTGPRLTLSPPPTRNLCPQLPLTPSQSKCFAPQLRVCYLHTLAAILTSFQSTYMPRPPLTPTPHALLMLPPSLGTCPQKHQLLRPLGPATNPSVPHPGIPKSLPRCSESPSWHPKTAPPPRTCPSAPLPPRHLLLSPPQPRSRRSPSGVPGPAPGSRT